MRYCFVGKNFVVRLSTTKTTKLFSPEKYPLYSILTIHTSVLRSFLSWLILLLLLLGRDILPLRSWHLEAPPPQCWGDGECSSRTGLNIVTSVYSLCRRIAVWLRRLRAYLMLSCTVQEVSNVELVVNEVYGIKILSDQYNLYPT